MIAKPLFDRVILKALPKEDTIKGSLIIPEQAIEIEKGVLIAIGDECKGKVKVNGSEERSITVGDKVLFPKGEGITITMDNENYLLMIERNLLAVI